jgi:hypothetical protein
MEIDLDGDRVRYFHERAQVEAQQGKPGRLDVSADARQRIMREVRDAAYVKDAFNEWRSFEPSIMTDIKRVLGHGFSTLSMMEFEVVKMEKNRFLSVLEISANHLFIRRVQSNDINTLNSILCDDLSFYRLRDVGNRGPLWNVQPINNPHLHAEVVDRTF